MANTLFPSSTSDSSSSQTAHGILDEMILCGNRVAEARKAELSRIEGLFFELSKRVKQEGLRVLTLSGGEVVEAVPAHNPNPSPDEDQERPRAGEESSSLAEAGLVPTSAVGGANARGLSAEGFEQGGFDSLDLIGISSYEFLSIVNQIDNPGVPYGVFDGPPEWLAGDDVPETFS